MSAEIISQTGDELTLQITVNLSGSMLEMEENIAIACNEVGVASSKHALERFDTDGSPIQIGQEKYTARSKDNKTYQTPYGEVEVSRYVYQSNAGGKIFVPLESAARIIHSATPKFAKMLSHKYSSMSAKDVLDDLDMNHSRNISKNYLQRVSSSVSDIIQSKEDRWEYALPELGSHISTISISMDGAMLPTCEDGWRESMVGTITLYDDEMERQHSIYIGTAPEYGKATFMDRMKKEVDRIKQYYPDATYIGIADGAKTNWPFLEKHTDQQVIDFYHVTEYLSKAAFAAHPSKTGKQERIKWLEAKCHQLKHDTEGPREILNELKRYTRKRKLPRDVRENLEAAITYLTNNIHRMSYAEHMKSNLPIGSGVTEAACKTLIKQRFCKSGMRWAQKGVKAVLRLREFMQTTGRWRQLWSKINQYGVPCLA